MSDRGEAERGNVENEVKSRHKAVEEETRQFMRF